jgi:hypothetical protein
MDNSPRWRTLKLLILRLTPRRLSQPRLSCHVIRVAVSQLSSLRPDERMAKSTRSGVPLSKLAVLALLLARTPSL